MSEQPTVVCVCLTADRPEMTARAVRCFESQAYSRKILVIWDSGDRPFDMGFCEHFDCAIWQRHTVEKQSIGSLRNQAAEWICNGPTPIPEIIIHWDSDDWSHPNRIAEQVALLQASDKECVGYREMLFWRDIQLSERDVYGPDGDPNEPSDVIEEAWLYTNNDPRYCLGTSLCYWRKTWERRPFQDRNVGEDKEWLREVDSLGVISITEPYAHELSASQRVQLAQGNPRYEPRMIAAIHGGNTSMTAETMAKSMYEGAPNFKRVPEWDALARERMAL